MKEKPIKLTPTLRFPEFRTNWVTKRLDSVAKPIVERAGNRSITPYTVTTGIGLVSQLDRFGRTIAGSSFKNYYVLRKNDFAYNKSATKAYPQGYIARFLGEEGAVPNSIFTCFRVNPDLVDPVYLDYLFAGNLHGRWLRRFIEVSARAHGSLSVDDGDLMSLPVPVPEGASSTAEQQKIAACLTSWDELIAAEGQKLEALRTHKTGLMQQLFPPEGKARPRLRFPEFRDKAAWDETTLGESVAFQAGGTPSKSNAAFWNGSIPWVSAKDMKQLLLDDTEDHISPAAIDDGATVAPAGALLVLTRGMTLLKDVPVCYLQREMSFNQDVRSVTPTEGLNGLFLTFLLRASKQRLVRMVDRAGHGTGRLETEKLRTFVIAIPRPAEQQRIAACLSSVDALVASQSRKLDALRAQKKGLMQQLFPPPERA
jgi:type I restriction enzyme S subunit